SAFSVIFNTPPTSAIYTLSLHDALPISDRHRRGQDLRHAGLHRRRRSVVDHTRPTHRRRQAARRRAHHLSLGASRRRCAGLFARSEEHTSELQSPYDLVCRLLLEKKKKK